MALAEITDIPAATAPPSTGNRIGVSAVAEIFWGIRALERVESDPPPHMDLDTAHARRLGQRLREFWNDGLTCWSEIFVLAARGGHLEDEAPEAFLEELPRLARLPLERRMLTTEDGPDRRRIEARLRTLATDSRLRASYTRLLEAVWDAQVRAWRREGRAAAKRTAASWAAQVERGTSLPAAAFVTPLTACNPEIVGMAERAASAGVLLAAPTSFGSGYSIVDAGPVTILSSAGERGSSHPSQVRNAARGAASRFKALSDPTRVAILSLLHAQPLTVGDVARRLELSQPTVSAHFAALRGAGLVREQQEGRIIRYSLDVTRMESILEELRGLVVNKSARVSSN